MGPEKYSDVLADWLVDLGYTHCFFVAGGNIMHLLDSCRQRFTCVATVHEVAAGIAAEYFNESGGQGKAFALVTAGPGVTNILTAMAGAWLENRDLLVVGGQVKSTDLAGAHLRQRGIQEVDGVAMCAPVALESIRIEQPISRQAVERTVTRGLTPRKGPVFVEVCLDAQGARVQRAELEQGPRAVPGRAPAPRADDVGRVRELLERAERPIVLIGGGVSRAAARVALEGLRRRRVPVMTTWNGHDRIDAREQTYLGRPNTWGQRSANVLLQQADLVVALGTRLGLQQTGFNWQEFTPLATLVQVDVEAAELTKGHPDVDVAICADADGVLAAIAEGEPLDVEPWLAFGREVRELLPLADPGNTHAPGFIDPFEFVLALSELCSADDVVIPCSSGGANTVFQQAFLQRAGQVVVGDKALASMGYGLSGAIGAALAWPGRRTIHSEGDGGFVQNLQELGTVAVNALNLKMFLHVNEGYASIRMTQRNYFGGAYLGCDTQSGLGFPDWPALFAAYRIPSHVLGEGWTQDGRFRELFDAPGPAAFIVPVDPEQTYFPKIASRVTASGSMESNPLHLMEPPLSDELAARVLAFLGAGVRS